MNTLHSIYICTACNLDCVNAAALNKHLSNCDKYSEWIKTYKSPDGIICDECDLKFININSLLDHKQRCK